VNGTYKTAKSLEWNGKLGLKSDDYFFYGYRPDSLKFTKQELRQRFQTFEGKVSLRNTEPTPYRINFYPNLNVSVFSGKNQYNKATEANTVLNLPLSKTIGKSFGINLGFTADLTTYRPANRKNTQNNLIIQPLPVAKDTKFLSPDRTDTIVGQQSIHHAAEPDGGYHYHRQTLYGTAWLDRILQQRFLPAFCKHKSMDHATPISYGIPKCGKDMPASRALY
jgi:hypothetical protein